MKQGGCQLTPGANLPRSPLYIFVTHKNVSQYILIIFIGHVFDIRLLKLESIPKVILTAYLYRTIS